MLRHLIGVLGLLTSTFGAVQAVAAEDWPVGVSCEVKDLSAESVEEFSRVSSGPWVTAERDLVRGDDRFGLRVEATNQGSWGVIYLKNQSTGTNAIKYGPAATQERFTLEFEGWRVECRQWPYIAG